MNFLDDPRRSDIEPMHEFFEIWSQCFGDRQRQNVSITYLAMVSIRNSSSRIEKIRVSILSGKRTRIVRADRYIIANKVNSILSNPDLWKGHVRDKDILVRYYRDVHPMWPLGKIAKYLDAKPWQVEKIVKDSLFFFSTLWKD